MRRRWSLSLMVVMLLHWCLGACAALADTLCFEPDGRVVLERADGPCVATNLEQASGKHCVDLPLHDGHDDHSSMPFAKAPALADAASTFFIPALTWLPPSAAVVPHTTPDATGPPVTALSVIIRETAYLLI